MLKLMLFLFALGPTLNKVVGIGGLYFVLACAESVLREIYAAFCFSLEYKKMLTQFATGIS
jgi:hypothetical protein